MSKALAEYNQGIRTFWLVPASLLKEGERANIAKMRGGSCGAMGKLVGGLAMPSCDAAATDLPIGSGGGVMADWWMAAVVDELLLPSFRCRRGLDDTNEGDGEVSRRCCCCC